MVGGIAVGEVSWWWVLGILSWVKGGVLISGVSKMRIEEFQRDTICVVDGTEEMKS